MSKFEIIGLTTSVIIGVVCCILHKKKGYNPIAGFFWGFLFNIFGLLIVIFEKTKAEHDVEMNKGSKSIGFYLALFVGIGTLIIAITLFVYSKMQTRNSNSGFINNISNNTNDNMIRNTINDLNNNNSITNFDPIQVELKDELIYTPNEYKFSINIENQEVASEFPYINIESSDMKKVNKEIKELV